MDQEEKMYFSAVIRKVCWWIAWVMLCIPAGVIVNSKLISLSFGPEITDEVLKVQESSVVLVLGAGTTTSPVSRNFSFSSRMDKTAELFRTGKIKLIIVSGISNKEYYNEPNDMKNELTRSGIPPHLIYPDHGGDRTFLSVKRAKSHTGQGPLIIISQRKQLERALFIAECLDIRAFGLEAASHPSGEGYRDQIRELLARSKSLFECFFNN